MKIYTFYERLDDPKIDKIVKLATAKVAGNKVEWEGDPAEVEKIKEDMTNQPYGLLNNQPFDLTNPFDWDMAPIIFSGTRFWCREENA